MIQYEIIAVKTKFGDNSIQRSLEELDLKIKRIMTANAHDRLIYEAEGPEVSEKDIKAIYGVYSVKRV